MKKWLRHKKVFEGRMKSPTLFRMYTLSARTTVTTFLFTLAVLFIPISSGAIATIETLSLSYEFAVDGWLEEAGSPSQSWSPYWWLSSGAYLSLAEGTGRTVQGSLRSVDTWRQLYARNNPIDTDNGYHPQNIFRLVTRSKWADARVESSFKINADNFSASPNRNQSNGLLLMLRYKDQNTLYYAGVRVDGTAVIKKKKNGIYTTLAQKKIFPGTYGTNPGTNLLPHSAWMSLRTESVSNGNGSVTVRLYVKRPGETSFTKVLEAIDASNPVSGSGYVGIRTDFMDIEFDDFKVEKM